MRNGNIIQEELSALGSSLPSAASGSLYEVPKGYFEGLAAAIMAKLKEGDAPSDAPSAAEEINQLSPLLAGISRKMPLEVPSGFFEEKLEDLSALTTDNESSLVLSFIEKEMPYRVPAGYFESLPELVMKKLAPPKAKVISMRSKFMRVATAAIVAGIITVSGVFYFNNNSKKNIPVDNPQWVASKLQNVSVKDLDEFVKTTDVATTAQSTPSKNSEVKKLLNDVSDKELDAFLSQVPDDDGDDLGIN
jgi:hypothetical protein